MAPARAACDALASRGNGPGIDERPTGRLRVRCEESRGYNRLQRQIPDSELTEAQGVCSRNGRAAQFLVTVKIRFVIVRTIATRRSREIRLSRRLTTMAHSSLESRLRFVVAMGIGTWMKTLCCRPTIMSVFPAM